MLTPEQKLKWAVLARQATFDDEPPPPYEAEAIEALYEAKSEDYGLQDAQSEVRCGGFDTGLKCEWSRHYESTARAMQMPDGSWVGWTYWYGGGKHGEPEAIEWISEAYDVKCVEEEKMVVVRTFTAAD